MIIQTSHGKYQDQLVVRHLLAQAPSSRATASPPGPCHLQKKQLFFITQPSEETEGLHSGSSVGVNGIV